MNKISLMWASDELDSFIERLVMDARDGKRQGLPSGVSDDLVFLAETNQIVRAIVASRKQGIPYRDALRKVEELDLSRKKPDVFEDPTVSRDLAFRDRGPDRRAATQEVGRDRRIGQERRHKESGDGVIAFFGRLIFGLLTSKAVIFIVTFALTTKMLWPYFFKARG